MDFRISAMPLDCTALAHEMRDASAGAFVSFEGWVRDNNEGQDVTALEYEAFHELAIAEGQRLLDGAKEKHGLTGARAVHREGALAIGDCAVWVGVTARHRAEAFAACREIMDEIKRRLPIWKKEHYAGGVVQWVNTQAHPTHDLTAADYYARQTCLPEIGAAGQRALGQARVLIVGLGGLGAAAAAALAGAGVGFLTLADPDKLDASNLHRQLIYSAADIGKAKAPLAAARLGALNPLVRIEALAEAVDAANVETLVAQHNVILDCTDNFAAKYLLNDAAMCAGKPLVQASIYRFEGQLLTIGADASAGCLRCLFPQAPPDGAIGDCATVGVLGTVPALFGTLQANEAIKQIVGIGASRDMLLFDLLTLDSRRIARQRSAKCPVCKGEKTNKENVMDEEEIDFTVDENMSEAQLRGRFRFVDVREADELMTLPLPDAAHLPMSAFEPATLDAPKQQPLLVVCARGRRSHAAAETLRALGWQQAYSLAGGIGMLGQLRRA